MERHGKRPGTSVVAMRVHRIGPVKSQYIQFIAFREHLWVGTWQQIEEASPVIIKAILDAHPRRSEIENDVSDFADNFVKDNVLDAISGYFDRKTRQITIDSGHSVPSSPLVRKVTEALRAQTVNQEYPDSKTQVYKKNKIKGDWNWNQPFYHGTSSEHFEGIVQFGLMPMPHQTNYENIVHDDAIFLTPTWNEAEHHALHTARGAYNIYSRKFKKKFVPMLVSVTVPDPARIIPDYDMDLSADATWYNHTSDPQGFFSGDSMAASKHSGLLGYKGRIPSKFIRALYFYSFYEKVWKRLTPDKFAQAVRGVQDQGEEFWYNRLGYPESEM